MKPASQLNEPPAQISPYAEKRNINLYKRNAPNVLTYAQLFIYSSSFSYLLKIEVQIMTITIFENCAKRISINFKDIKQVYNS